MTNKRNSNSVHAERVDLMLILFFLLGSLGTSYKIVCGDFSIGRHIITKKKVWNAQETLLYLQFDQGNSAEMTTSLGYGFTETIGCQMNIPVLVHENLDGISVKGLENIAFLGQWHFHQNSTNVAVAISGVELPTQTFKRPFEVNAPISYINDLIYVHSS